MENTVELNLPKRKNRSNIEKTPDKKTFGFWQALIIIVLFIVTINSIGYTIGKLYFWTNNDIARVQKQVDYYQQLVAKEPKKPENRVALGFAYYQLKKYDQAVAHLKTATQIDPKYFDAYLNLGYVYTAMKKYDDALENFDKCTKLSPQDYQGWLNSGVVLIKLKRYDKALDALNQANMINPGSADIYYYAGQALEGQGSKKEAISEYQQALKFDPNNQDAQKALDRLK